MLFILAGQSSAQLAYNTHTSSATHAHFTGARNTKGKQHKVHTQYLDITNVPDSIAKKANLASQKIVKLFVATLGKPCDSTYCTHSWTSYKSMVIGGPAQVLIDISCRVTRNKNPRRAPGTRYTIIYQADANIYKLTYDSNKKTAKVAYNESHWPGFMHTDKTPSKADLDRDISTMLDHIVKDEAALR